MRSHVTAAFRRHFNRLPQDIQQRARTTYKLWKKDPAHPGAAFKRVHPRALIYSVRVGLGWRAVGAREGNKMIWFWIGSHDDYDELLRRL